MRSIPDFNAERFMASAKKQVDSVSKLLRQCREKLKQVKTAEEANAVHAAIKKLRFAADELKIERFYARSNPKQRMGVQAFFTRKDYDIFAWVGGNRSGKTICGVMGPGMWLRDHAKANDVYWMVSPNAEKSVSGQQKELWQALPRRMFGDQVYNSKNGFSADRPTLILPAPGTRYDAKGKPLRTFVVRFKTAAQYDSDPASFEQEKVAGVWIDETVGEKVYDALLPRVTDLDAWIVLTTIPDTKWINSRLRKAAVASRIQFVKYCMKDNEENLPPGTLEKKRQQMSPEDAKMRIDGDFRFLQGLVYSEFIEDYKPEGHLVRPFVIPASWPRLRGLDYGMSHPTVCLWFAVSPNNTIFIYREYRSKNQTVERDAEAIKALSTGESYRYPYERMIIDANAYNRTKASPRNIAQQFEAHGIPCTPAIRGNKKGGEWYHVNVVKERLNLNGLFVFDTCQGLITEFGTWEYKSDNQGSPLASDAFEDKNNDGLDVVKYVLGKKPRYGTPQAGVGGGHVAIAVP